jgi:uncharacterized protein (DUF362 family)
MSLVAITQNFDIGAAISQALKHMPLERLVRGKLVGVKPNDTWASAENTSGVTQPDSLRAVLRELKRFGPKHIVVSGGSGAAQTADVFRISGMMSVIEEEGAEFFDHNRPPFAEVALEYMPEVNVTGPQNTVMVNPRVLEYDTLIALNQLKVHETATVTLSLKNIAMSFPAADYYGHPRSSQRHENFFFSDMHSFIAAMARRFRADLAITLGHPAMVGTGPIGGHVVETGIVIASIDPVAADVVGARLLGFEPQGVRYLWEAQRLDVGQADTRQMNFPEMSLRDAIQAFTHAVYGKRLTFEHA